MPVAAASAQQPQMTDNRLTANGKARFQTFCVAIGTDHLEQSRWWQRAARFFCSHRRD
jgi:hypothetical protein